MTWILDQGARVSLARFDAGLIGPDLLQAIKGRVDPFVCRIRPNENLERLADPLEPPMPLFAGARSSAEFIYGAETWEAPQRVVVRFYQQRGESERVFGEFVTTLQPTLRQIEVRKNSAWFLLVALAHNVLADLRDQLPKAE